jgi:hypothetical protein
MLLMLLYVMVRLARRLCRSCAPQKEHTTSIDQLALLCSVAADGRRHTAYGIFLASLVASVIALLLKSTGVARFLPLCMQGIDFFFYVG